MKRAVKIVKSIAKKIAPKFAFSIYHFLLAYIGAVIYGFPSKRMVVVGTVGTRGKTTVGNLIWSCLTTAGYKTGLTGTANIRIGSVEKMNPYHMTMPGRFRMQKILREMADQGCQFAIVETPSEGVEQWRHKGIFYDCLVTTKIYPEYMEIHGWDFERALRMDEAPFKALAKSPRKRLNRDTVKKSIAVEAGTEYTERFLKHSAEVKVTYGMHAPADIFPENLQIKEFGSSFSVSGTAYELRIPGEYNVLNALAAIAACSALGVKKEAMQKGLLLDAIPGRMEKIDLGQDFGVYVDYAHDAVSLDSVLDAARSIASGNSVIVLFGGQGGGRDVKKLPVMGEVSAKKADVVILTTDDPFDEDPAAIAEKIAPGAEKNKKVRGKDLLMILDRREAIRSALKLAKRGDVVLVAGKGAEQSMVTKAGNVPWDDRAVVREELQNLGHGVQ